MQTVTPPTVMVLNDDVLQLRLAAAWLKKDGLCILTCQSADEVLGLLHNGVRVDAIVTDLHMPRLAGWRLCRLLRCAEHAGRNQVPMLGLSAPSSDINAIQMAHGLSANAFLPLFHEPATLRAYVRDLLAGRAPHDPLRVRIEAAHPTLTTLLRRLLESHGDVVQVAGTGTGAKGLLLASKEVAETANRSKSAGLANVSDAIRTPIVQADGSMLRRHGGTVCMESTVGVGSTFHCTVQVEVQPDETAAVPVTAALHGLRVLVVEAQATMRRMVHDLLVRGQMCPTLVESAPAALAALDQAHQAGRPFAGIVLDADLPDEDSLIVALWLKHHPELATTPLVVFTTPMQGRDQQRWQDLDVAACLTIPIAEAELWQALHQALTPPSAVPVAPPHVHRTEGQVGRSLHVLLAEDTLMHQRLAVSLLAAWGHTVTVVPDGTEAVAAVQRQPFDLVLMDLQMPQMDGLEATRLIRQREHGTGRYVPIVAMTAHILPGDRAHCLRAGMDGYVPKPLRPAELFEIIAQLTAPVARHAVSPLPPAAAEAILNRKTLWERVDGDVNLLREIVGLFLADCPERLAELHAALALQDSPALGRAAHRFKGALGNISASSAVTVVQRVEALARAGDLPAVGSALAMLEGELGRLTPLLTVWLGEGQPDLNNVYA